MSGIVSISDADLTNILRGGTGFSLPGGYSPTPDELATVRRIRAYFPEVQKLHALRESLSLLLLNDPNILPRLAMYLTVDQLSEIPRRCPECHMQYCDCDE